MVVSDGVVEGKAISNGLRRQVPVQPHAEIPGVRSKVQRVIAEEGLGARQIAPQLVVTNTVDHDVQSHRREAATRETVVEEGEEHVAILRDVRELRTGIVG